MARDMSSEDKKKEAVSQVDIARADTEPGSGKRNKWEHALQVIEEEHEKTKAFDCATDVDDPYVQTFHDEKLGVVFLTLSETTDPEDIEQSAIFRNAAQEEITRRARSARQGNLARSGTTVSKMDPGTVLSPAADRASIILSTSLRASTEILLARRVVEKQIARLTGNVNGEKRLENLKIPPSIAAMIHEESILPEAVYGVPLAQPGEEQQMPEIEWDSERNIWLGVNKETERVRIDLLDAAESLRTEIQSNPAATNDFLKKITALQTETAFSHIGPDVRLAISEEAKKALPKLPLEEKQQILDALDTLREPRMSEEESTALTELLRMTEIARRDERLAKNGSLTKDGATYIKQQKAFGVLSPTAGRIVLFDRLRRQGVLSPNAAHEILTDTRMEIVGQTDARISVVIVRSSGEVTDISDSITGEQRQEEQIASNENFHVQKNTQKKIGKIPLRSGDTVLFSTRNSTEETPADTGEIRIEASNAGSDAHNVLQAMKENGFKGAVLRIP